MKRLTHSYSRPGKLSDTDTVVYEIDMLRFAATKLHEGNWREEREAWVYLEGFLLHFRNFIEFLGKKNPSGTDLHITTIWKLVPAPDNVPEIYEKGKQLLCRYEPKSKDGGGRISQYLSHCTTKRTDSKHWPIDEMNKQIEPLLQAIEAHLRAGKRALLERVRPVEFLEPLEANSTVATHTAVLPVLVGGLDVLGRMKKRPHDK
jgi:hypothetical protein